MPPLMVVPFIVVPLMVPPEWCFPMRVPVIVPAVTLPKFALIADKFETLSLSAEMAFAAIWFEVMAFAAICWH